MGVRAPIERAFFQFARFFEKNLIPVSDQKAMDLYAQCDYAEIISVRAVYYRVRAIARVDGIRV